MNHHDSCADAERLPFAAAVPGGSGDTESFTASDDTREVTQDVEEISPSKQISKNVFSTRDDLPAGAHDQDSTAPHAQEANQHLPPREHHEIQASLARPGWDEVQNKEQSHTMTPEVDKQKPPVQAVQPTSMPNSDLTKNDEMESRTDISPAIDSHDVIRLAPVNPFAREAMHILLLKKKKGELDPHHAQFIVATTETTRKSQQILGGSRLDGETTEEDSTDPDEDEEFYTGYFRINFACRFLTAGLILSTAGRGSGKRFGPQRNVDILLAPPNTQYSRKLAANHLLFKMHEKSGAWILQSNSPFSINEKRMEAGDSFCLSRPQTRCELAGLHFSLQFQIDSVEKEQIYLNARDDFLRQRNVPLPMTDFTGIPFENDGISGDAVYRRGLGSGSFGIVFEGINKRTGNLLAVKKIIVSSKKEWPIKRPEIEALERLRNTVGVVRLYEWRDRSGNNRPEAFCFPSEITIVMEVGRSFNKLDWTSAPLNNWELRQQLFGQLLNGLIEIHSRSWMHRDITPMNIIFIEERKAAALCDFGKVHFRRTDDLTALAAWNWLPPEIQQGMRISYDQKIDIWMLAFSLLWSWFPELRGYWPRQRAHWKHIMKFLDTHEESPFFVLFKDMLAWKPQDRPGAGEILSEGVTQGWIGSKGSEGSQKRRMTDEPDELRM